MSAKPAVDRLDSEIQDKFSVIRVNITSDVGKYVRTKYRGNVVPTFIVLDAQGNEIWRKSGSVPRSETILALARS